MNRKVAVYLIDGALEEFANLNKAVGEQKARGATDSEEMQLLNSIRKKKELLEQNPEYGDKVPHRLIPKNLVTRYNLTNL